MEQPETVTLTPLADGFCLGAAPRWFEGLLWFSDTVGEAVHTVNLARKVSTLALPGHQPSGLGFHDGSLLIVSATARVLLRYDGETTEIVADLSDVVPANLGDLVVDRLGRAYVGSQAFLDGLIVKVGQNASTDVVADRLDHPSGMVITADGRTLIVAESTARRLTAFTIRPDGSLSDRRTFADRLDGPPEGIALDEDGGLWVAMTSAHQFQRVSEAGTVTDRIDMGNRSAVACTLGGPERRLLFLLSIADVPPKRLSGPATCRLDATPVHASGVGLP